MRLKVRGFPYVEDVVLNAITEETTHITKTRHGNIFNSIVIQDPGLTNLINVVRLIRLNAHPQHSSFYKKILYARETTIELDYEMEGIPYSYLLKATSDEIKSESYFSDGQLTTHISTPHDKSALEKHEAWFFKKIMCVDMVGDEELIEDLIEDTKFHYLQSEKFREEFLAFMKIMGHEIGAIEIDQSTGECLVKRPGPAKIYTIEKETYEFKVAFGLGSTILNVLEHGDVLFFNNFGINMSSIMQKNIIGIFNDLQINTDRAQLIAVCTPNVKVNVGELRLGQLI